MTDPFQAIVGARRGAPRTHQPLPETPLDSAREFVVSLREKDARGELISWDEGEPPTEGQTVEEFRVAMSPLREGVGVFRGLRAYEFATHASEHEVSSVWCVSDASGGFHAVLTLFRGTGGAVAVQLHVLDAETGLGFGG